MIWFKKLVSSYKISVSKRSQFLVYVVVYIKSIAKNCHSANQK